ncbi:MAG: DNA/RNA non-specific endonuclease [Clostridia bacterium]|nr:DNA/RNA non-specific endonuclease [Clostridia bacterium]
MGRRKKSEKFIKEIISIVVFLIIILGAYLSYSSNNNLLEQNNLNTGNTTSNTTTENNETSNNTTASTNTTNLNIENIPEYTNKVAIEINNNKPYFDESNITKEAFETYSDLDSKGRCGVAFANICKEIMPVDGQKRESISKVKPTGWEQKKVNGEYVYNRCHLIGYQLAAENANEKNLITGTRYFNVEGMLPYENKVAEYIEKNKNNHVLYRVTPVFKGENLLASGVEMEALSVEDEGKGLYYNVFVYNIQPGVTIDYTTGKIQ